MSREKQIEEMAKCCTYYHNGECCADATHICDCDLMCEMFGVFANLEMAGYRKQNVGEWVAYPDEHEICATEFVCSNCKDSFCTNEMTDWQFIETMKFCPNCGAKMKGGAE